MAEIGELKIRITGDAKDLEAAISSAQSALDSINGTSAAKNIESATTKAAKGVESATTKAAKGFEDVGKKAAKTKDWGKGLTNFGNALNDATKPLQYTSAALAAGGVAAAKFAIDFENNFARVQKTVEGTPEQLEEVKESIIALTTTGIDGRSAIPATTAELTELAAAGGQLGIKTESIAEFTEVMAQMGSATNLSGEEGAATLARLMNVTGTSQDEVRSLGSAIVDLGNNFATTENEIATLAMRMGATGSIVGMSTQDILGYSTALSSMGVEAEAGGSAVSRIWMDIQTAVSAGGEDLQAFAEVSGVSAAEFAEQWETDASGAFKSFLEGLSESKDQIGTLSDLGFGNIRDITALQKLASETGINLVTEALQRSNTAWRENTALQKEADAMANTTAGQLQITKNNIVETARSLGEVMLPTVSKASTTVREFAQKLNDMDDGQKESLVNTAAAVVAVGAGTKAVAAAATTAGKAITGMKTLGSGLKTVGTTLLALPLPAKIAAAAIAALAAGGYAVYKAWDKNTNHWADDFAESAAQLKETASEYSKVIQLRQEYASAKATLANPDASTEELDAAKAKIEEIKTLLQDEYKMVITSDTTGVNDALDLLDSRTRRDLMENGRNAVGEMDHAAEKYAKSTNDLEYYDKKTAELTKQIAAYNKLEAEANKLAQEVGSGTNPDWYEDWYNLNERFAELKGSEFDGYNGFDVANLAGAIRDQADAVEKELGKLDEDYNTALDARDKFMSAMQTSSEAYATMLSEDVKNGNTDYLDYDTAQFERIGRIAKEAGASTDNLALSFAEARAGYTDFNDAVANGADMGSMAQRFIDFKQSIGDFEGNESTVIGTAAAIKNGFTNISDAAAAGGDAINAVIADIRNLGAVNGIDVSAESLTEIAHAIGLIPDNKEIKFSADTHELEVVDVPDVEGTANYTGNFPTQASTLDGVANYTGIFPKQAPTLSGVANYTVHFSGATGILAGVTGGKTVHVDASGTSYHPGGWAMVNDQAGAADPRELVIDRGRAFIPEGRNVLLPLSKGAKVYTAKQTRDIMRGMGIRRYASGVSNSDAFTTARDDWTHYTSTHAVTTSEELAKWAEFSEQFKDNLEDVKDIEEQIYSLTVKQTQEMNEESLEYVKNVAKYYQWGGDDTDYGMYQRIEARNRAELDAGRLTWQEYKDNIKEVGDTILDTRKDQSLDWIEYQKKYCNMSADEEIAAYSRISTYIQEYYDNGLIDYAAYMDAKTEINEKYLDAYQDSLDEADEARQAFTDSYYESADNWYKIRSTYDDWDEYGDSEEQYYLRRVAAAEQLYRDGNITWQEYMDNSMDDYLNMYKAAETRLDDELSAFRDEISAKETEFNEEEQALRDSWDVEDRETDLDEVNRLLGIYENAVTSSGQEKYKDLLEQKKQLERDEELYQLQQSHQATLDNMEDEYVRMQSQNNGLLRRLRTDTFNVFSTVKTDIAADTLAISDMSSRIMNAISDGSGNTVTGLLARLLAAVAGGGATSAVSSMRANVKSSYTIAGDTTDIIKKLTGTVVSGLGDVVIMA